MANSCDRNIPIREQDDRPTSVMCSDGNIKNLTWKIKCCWHDVMFRSITTTTTTLTNGEEQQQWPAILLMMTVNNIRTTYFYRSSQLMPFPIFLQSSPTLTPLLLLLLFIQKLLMFVFRYAWCGAHYIEHTDGLNAEQERIGANHILAVYCHINTSSRDERRPDRIVEWPWATDERVGGRMIGSVAVPDKTIIFNKLALIEMIECERQHRHRHR